MKKIAILAVAALALAACGPSAPEAEPEAPAAPQGLMEQVLALSAEQQPVQVLAYLNDYLAANPDAARCEAIRETGSRGVIPADAAPDTVYGPHIGALVFSVQCGPLRTGIASRPQDHWLIVLAPGAPQATVVSCANAQGRDQCPPVIPRAAPATP